jgi:hypothetical protein
MAKNVHTLVLLTQVNTGKIAVVQSGLKTGGLQRRVAGGRVCLVMPVTASKLQVSRCVLSSLPNFEHRW